MSTREEHFSNLLKAKGLKVTSGRLDILRVLDGHKEPLSVATLHELVKKKIDQVTVYRTLESLISIGLVSSVDLRHGHAHYELTDGRHHHHHVICQSCGDIEDVEECDMKSISKKVLKDSKKFSHINEHSLEFFGVCNKCSR